MPESATETTGSAGIRRQSFVVDNFLQAAMLEEYVLARPQFVGRLAELVRDV